MPTIRILLTCLFAALAVGGRATAVAAEDTASDPAGIEFFEKRIRPVLAAKCLECHGTTTGESKRVKGGLRLDSRTGMLEGGDSGPAVVPASVERSLIIAAIRHTDTDLKMPPKEKLPAEQIADFEAWIKMGAPMPADAPSIAGKKSRLSVKDASDFWSLRPVQSLKAIPLPAVKDEKWVRSPIDRFIVAKLQSVQLSPARMADRRTLIRRATFDLIGLPPTPAEVEAFVGDAGSTEEAFAKVVDRLLASPHYGERWGRHWMDLVRYADTAGDNSDYPVPQAYLYRNYIIDSLNADKPYDQFVREQIAGDQLPHETWNQRNEQVIATGYIAMSRRFGSVVDRYPYHLTIEDTLDNLGKTFLGLSLGCARCHDHKFDPVTQADYYGLYGMFESTRYAFPGIELLKVQHGFVPLVPPDQLDQTVRQFMKTDTDLESKHNELLLKRRVLERSKETLKAELAGANEQERKKLTQRIIELDKQTEQVRKQIKGAASALEQHRKKAPPIDGAYGVLDLPDGAADSAIHIKGDPENTGETVPRRFLTVLGGQTLSPEEARHSGRLQLAQWITSRKNPLFARVMVNRLWHYHFGRGIVATTSDFGFRGTPPTHPELLDYLAARFIDEGWSLKKMHRLIMTSRVYMQASADTADDTASGSPLAVDPDNALLWCFPRKRLDAESLRDAMMFIAGTLDLSPMRQPHPFPPREKWGFTQHYPFKDVYPTQKRSVYIMTRRLNTLPFFVTFDGADHNATTPTRNSSVTTVQALYFLNDEFVHEQAAHLATRLLNEAKTDDARIDLAMALVLGRPPSEEERRMLRGYLADLRGNLGDGKSPDDPVETQAWRSVARVLLRMNEFAYVD